MRSFVDPVSNVTVLSSINLARDSGNLLQFRFPVVALPAFLHEMTHHWCFLSPVGSTLSLLRHRVRRQAILMAASQSKLVAEMIKAAIGTTELAFPFERYSVSDLMEDLIRYETALSIMRPIAEGLALFAEYDATPRKSPAGGDILTENDATPDMSEIISIPMHWAAMCFHRNENYDEKMESLILERFLMVLLKMRLSGEFSRRRADLLVQPLACDNGGYLPGYLTLKTLWHAALQKCSRFSESDFFFTYVCNYFFRDFGFVAAVLEPDLRLHQIADSITWYFRKRLESFLNSNLSNEVRIFEESFQRKPGLFEQIPGISTNPALSLIGRKRFGTLISEISNIESHPKDLNTVLRESTAWRFAQREIMCLGSLPVNTCVNENLHVQATVNGKTVYSGPALEGVTPGEGKGAFEINLSHPGNFVAVSVSREGHVVSNLFLSEISEQARQQFESYLLDRSVEELEVQAYEDMIDIVLKVNQVKGIIEDVRNMIIYAHNQLYKQWATQRVPGSCREQCTKKMEKSGFWELFEENSVIIRGLATLGLTTSFRIKKDFVKRHLEAQGFDFGTLLASVLEYEKKSGFQCILDMEDELYCLI